MVNANSYKISASDLTVIRNLANQCPYEYGRAVYLARALCFANGDFTMYENNCNSEGGNEQKSLAGNGNDHTLDKVNEQNKVTVYPNPANRTITVEFSKPVNDAYINIYDIAGRLQKNILLNTDVKKETVNISDLDNGMYFIKITTLNNVYLHKIIKE